MRPPDAAALVTHFRATGAARPELVGRQREFAELMAGVDAAERGEGRAFMYLAAVGAGFFASYLAVVQQIGEVSSGGYFLIFWMFQNPPDLLYSVLKAMAMAVVIVIVGCYYGYTASGGPVGVGTATAKSMVVNTVMVHLVGMLGTQIFWGTNPRAPIGG
jgi:phospholipid/cholesterol/gamma-HCH transport system permease protein